MATIKLFEELEIWQMARKYSKLIFKLSSSGEFSRDFKFKSQILSAAGSIMDNIAEGFERGGKLEFIQFLSIAKGSCGETQSQGYRAFDFNYISEDELNQLEISAKELGSKIGNLITYLNKSIIKGSKFKDRRI
ncbi:MAG: four helix bundle protein [Chitinophagaceae bacterium]|nr:four helix bundle protein [Chitinophagaceae bacterium]